MPKEFCNICLKSHEPDDCEETVTPPNQQIPTPRTDACLMQHKGMPCNQALDLLTLARQLERELQEANAKLKTVSRLIDLSQKSMVGKTNSEIAASAEFAEAVAYTQADIVEEELNEKLQQLQKQNQELRDALLLNMRMDMHDKGCSFDNEGHDVGEDFCNCQRMGWNALNTPNKKD